METVQRIRPSNLIDWATCQKRALHEANHPPERVGPAHIGTWVGSLAHAIVNKETPPECPAYILFDEITNNRSVALVQAERIAHQFQLALDSHGFRLIASEVAVGDQEPAMGTLDHVLEQDGGRAGVIVSDLKTGRVRPSGVWLQLGAYMWATWSTDHNLSFFHGDPIVGVASFWIKRATVIGGAEVEIRTPRGCMEAARLVGFTATNILHENQPPLPSPGMWCSKCPAKKTCAVGSAVNGFENGE